MEIVEGIIKAGSLVTAITVICVGIYKVVRWIMKVNKNSSDIEELKKKHSEDIDETRKKESEELQELKKELCVLSYAMLAALDGLRQQGCNGEVTKAHETLSKHLNQQAHDQ